MYQIQKNQTPASNRRYDGDSISGDYNYIIDGKLPQASAFCASPGPLRLAVPLRLSGRPAWPASLSRGGERHVFSSNSNDHSTIFLELEARACASVREQHEAAVKCTITILVRMCKARTDALYSAMSYWLRRGCAIV